MFIAFVKFIHLVCVLSSVGLVSMKLWFPQSNPKTAKITTLILFAGITGCLLVYPKGYTFHTAWIRAALCLITIVIIGLYSIKALYYLPRKKIHSFLQIFIYSILLIILLIIINDAVQKTTEIPLSLLGLST